MKPLNQCATMIVMRLLALPAIAAVALVGCGSSPGALENSAWPGAVEISHPTSIGNTVAFGGPMTLVNESNDDVVVTDVRFDRIDDSLIYLGWVIRDFGGATGGSQSGTGVTEPFPPPGSRTVGDNTVAPATTDADDTAGMRHELVVGLTLQDQGTATAQDVVVEYRDASGNHSVTFPLTAVLCGSRSDFPNGCAEP